MAQATGRQRRVWQWWSTAVFVVALMWSTKWLVQVWADTESGTMEISEIPLGGVIAVNGRRFVKINLNDEFVAVDVFCPKDMIYDVNYGACVKVYGCTGVTGTMQTWDECGSLATPTGTGYTQGPCLMDERDGKTYQVRKFADGRCWMADNLAYGGADLNPDGSDGCMQLSMCGFGFQPNGECATLTTQTTGSAEGLIAPGLYGDCRYSYNSLSTPDTNKYGYLYNWQAAVQNPESYYGHDYQPSTPVQGLCPDGWILPAQNLFEALHTAVGSSIKGFWQPGKAWNGVFSGNCGYNGGSANNQGQIAWLWSATQINDKNAYTMRYSSNDVAANNSSPKGNGFAIRCIKQ